MASLSLITLNCFGVPTSKTRRRLSTLARTLNQTAATVVCLQEVQTHPYCRLLTQMCTAYPSQAHWPHVHAPKGGLLTLGQVPFGRSVFWPFNERGMWYTFGMADWLLRKGVLQTSLQGCGIPIVVLNTHLHANYNGDWHPTNRFARIEQRQLQQLAAIVQAQPSEALVLVAGDFNIPRGSWLYDEFLAASQLTDPLSGDTRPTYRALPGLPGRFALPIDFALLRTPALPSLRITADLIFQDKQPLVGGGMHYLSDHCGVCLHLTWDD